MTLDTPKTSDGFSFLLVEDDEASLALFRRALRRMKVPSGFHVASDGQQAIDYLAGKGEFSERSRFPFPCLVILDIQLPKRSGLDVLQWIRSQPKLVRLPVVMLTTSNDPGDIRQAADLGANAYWVKPLELRALDRIARRVWTFLRMFCECVRAEQRDLPS